MSNVPDDWGCYYTTCETCGERYHESEGGCSGCDKCEQCGEWKSLRELEDNDMVCEDCLCCQTCGELTDNNHRYFIIAEDEDFDPNNLPTRKDGKLECEVLCLKCLNEYKNDPDYDGYRYVRVE